MRTTVEKMQWLARLNQTPDITLSALKVAIALADSLNCKYHRCNPSVNALIKATGLSDRSITRGLEFLVENGVIHRHLEAGRKSSFDLLQTQSVHEKPPTQVSPPTEMSTPDTAVPTTPDTGDGTPPTQVTKNDHPLLIEETVKETVKEKPRFSISDGNRIIDHLNRVTGSKFRLANGTKNLLQMRVKQGANPEDFISVIDTKHSEWSGNPKMAMYLRPETLFGTKFDSYLAQADTPAPKSGVDEWLEEQQIQDNVIDGEFTRGR